MEGDVLWGTFPEEKKRKKKRITYNATAVVLTST